MRKGVLNGQNLALVVASYNERSPGNLKFRGRARARLECLVIEESRDKGGDACTSYGIGMLRDGLEYSRGKELRNKSPLTTSKPDITI
jgi:hypothetical protein